MNLNPILVTFIIKILLVETNAAELLATNVNLYAMKLLLLVETKIFQ